ncbi:CRISPR-associated endonuclease Cas4/Cas1 [Corynebacterium freiburgense]|uniref:CRISPR-associated endonuclease Cas4/Cas1 n=1 Tax=Corynebacterium freiburgense TaxID=556548 RepID=UPI0004222871|nr:CRISPR-associated endonuclease Cas4/Cas1 [Corynebacterium freiburgense]
MSAQSQVRDTDVIPISLVVHTVFCPRRAWLETNGEQTDTAQMQHGHSAHKNVDRVSTSRKHQQRSVPVSSPSLGLVGRCDAIEEMSNGELRVVEYKATPIKRTPKVTEANRMQLVLQGICLTEEGRKVTEYAVHFTDHHKTVSVDIDDDDRQRALEFLRRTRKIVESSVAPPPLIDSPLCNLCSHISVCLPDEHHGKVLERRVLASNPDSQIAHITTQGARASVQRGRLRVVKGDEVIGDVPMERIQGVVVHGNIDLSSALIRELLWRNSTVVWCSSSGRVYGWSKPAYGPNGLARLKQHVMSDRGNLLIASEMISCKIANQATLLRRNGHDSETVETLRKLQKDVLEIASQQELFGLEGEAASLYFSSFSSMLREKSLQELDWQWIGRHGRGANDHINILLNYTYALLVSECIRAILSCGLDPHAGFLHSSNRNKPALALDLMEEFRAPIADSVVITLINRHQLSKRSFSRIGNVLRLSEDGRKAVISAFEKRINTEFRHPVFEYSVTWRRAIEVQARLVLGVIDGTQKVYRGVKIR